MRNNLRSWPIADPLGVPNARPDGSWPFLSGQASRPSEGSDRCLQQAFPRHGWMGDFGPSSTAVQLLEHHYGGTIEQIARAGGPGKGRARMAGPRFMRIQDRMPSGSPPDGGVRLYPLLHHLSVPGPPGSYQGYDLEQDGHARGDDDQGIVRILFGLLGVYGHHRVIRHRDRLRFEGQPDSHR